jgi:hypothetical protein
MKSSQVNINIDIPHPLPNFLTGKLRHKPSESSYSITETKRVFPWIEKPTWLPPFFLPLITAWRTCENDKVLVEEEILRFAVHEQAGLRYVELRFGPYFVPASSWYCVVIEVLISSCAEEVYVPWWRVAVFPGFETEVFGKAGEEVEAGSERGL